jgi:hypothetical protein
MKRLEHFLAISFRLKGCDVDFGTFLPIKYFEHFDTLKILCHLHFKVRSALQGQIRSTAKGQIRSTAKGQIRSTAKGQIRSTAKCNLAKAGCAAALPQQPQIILTSFSFNKPEWCRGLRLHDTCD